MKDKNSVIYYHDFETRDAFIEFAEKHKEQIQTVIVDEQRLQGLDKEAIILIAVRFSKFEVIYVFNEYAPENEDFLLNWGIFNLVLSHDEKTIQQLIEEPRSLYDALHFKEQHGLHENCPYCEAHRDGIWYDSDSVKH